ncbi:MAG: hypothetical protein GXY33_02675 [Phycisphaerae bacterium]|nr:hypothetical protein [Phycisphaerae bacterium]
MRNMKVMLGVAALAAVVLGPMAMADTFILEDLNTTVVLDNSTGSGMYEWDVEGVNHLSQQWFWMRMGQDREYRLDHSGGPVAANATDRDASGQNDTLYLKYDYDLYTVEVTYMLTGGEIGSFTSDMAETIKITSRCQDALDLHFFQYTDLDLNSTISDDTVELANTNKVEQRDALTMFSETVVTPNPSRYEVNTWPSTLVKLEDDVASDLDNNDGPLTGDATWAFQWDFVLGHYGDTFIISKDKLLTSTPIPAPGAVLLGALGLWLVGRIKRRLA